MSCGIYMIKNKINQKIYIGQSINIQQRWQAHRNSYYHKNFSHLPLYAAFSKYGKENFELIILEECPISELDSKEIEYIKYFNGTDPHIGYNLEPGGYGRRGYKTSEKTLEKLRLAHSGHAPTNNRPVYCIEKDLEADSIKNMAIKLQGMGLKATASAIGNCLTGKSHTHLGLHFIYLEDKENKEKIKEVMLASTNNAYKKIQCVETGKIYNNAAEVEREIGISRSCIRDVCRKYRNAQTAGGYHWKYYETEEE